jgi:transposase
MLERARYGKHSEKLRIASLDDEQYGFVFDEMETGLSEIEAGLDKLKGKAGTVRAPRPRKGFAAHLERIEVVVEPEDPPGCEGLEKVRIGEDSSERLDVIPVKFRVIRTIRPKYAYPAAHAPDSHAPRLMGIPQGTLPLRRDHSRGNTRLI